MKKNFLNFFFHVRLRNIHGKGRETAAVLARQKGRRASGEETNCPCTSRPGGSARGFRLFSMMDVLVR
jgi:hypothetical protein